MSGVFNLVYALKNLGSCEGNETMANISLGHKNLKALQARRTEDLRENN